jgi:hypothetical protein
VSEPVVDIIKEVSKATFPDDSPIWTAWEKWDEEARREFVECHLEELKPFLKAALKNEAEHLELVRKNLRKERGELDKDRAELDRKLKEYEKTEIGELVAQNDELRRKLDARKEPGQCGWERTDGGRRAAGYGGPASDCVARAITIATEKPYAEVFEALKETAADYVRRWPQSKAAGWIKKSRGEEKNAHGCYDAVSSRYLKSIGWKYTRTKGRLFLRADQLPRGRLVVHVNRHFVAVIDGVIHDTYDSGGAGKRPVEGYWQKA